VLPALSNDQIQTLIKELKADGKIYKTGTTRSALWYPGSSDAIASVKKEHFDIQGKILDCLKKLNVIQTQYNGTIDRKRRKPRIHTNVKKV